MTAMMSRTIRYVTWPRGQVRQCVANTGWSGPGNYPTITKTAEGAVIQRDAHTQILIPWCQVIDLADYDSNA